MCCELWVLSDLQVFDVFLFCFYLWQTQPQRGTKALILGGTQSVQSLIWTGRGCGCHWTPQSSVLSTSPLCLYGWATKPFVKWKLMYSQQMFNGCFFLKHITTLYWSIVCCWRWSLIDFCHFISNKYFSREIFLTCHSRWSTGVTDNI